MSTLPKPSKGVVWIYGIVSQTGTMLYVGQTSSPRTRWSGHKSKHIEFANAEFRILQQTDQSNAADLEQKTILDFQANGEAKLNTRIHKCDIRRQWRDQNRQLKMLWIPDEIYQTLRRLKKQTGIPLNRLVADAIREKYNKKPLTRGAKHNEL